MMNQQQIEEIYETYKTPKNIINHMNQVAKVCEILADAANKKGLKVDKELIIQAAKLHDTLRPCDFRDFDIEQLLQSHPQEAVETWQKLRKEYGHIGHAGAMHNLLLEVNEPKLAQLVKMHDFGQIDNLKTWNEKILYYADKRVDRDKIVPMEQRMAEGKKRNFKEGDNEQAREVIMNKLRKLEQELIQNTGFSIN